ncbi:MAG: riboflavin synthase [Candidatus Tokpelaia sp. JSC188]|nr:MAG: riboflavin synthase [Candidatus Tokpelaia sp. JSC188]
MFTGLVTSVGTIESCKKLEGGVQLRVFSDCDNKTLRIGASISCSGICLTIVDLPTEHENAFWFTVEAWEETLQLTTLSSWDVGTHINLERSMKLGDEIGGHFVFGHVDGIAKILSIRNEGAARRFEIKVPIHLTPFITSKGSICLDGTSLTVNHIDKNIFNVLLVRHTLDITTWDERKDGDNVNIEIDQFSRCLSRFSEFAKNSG